MIAKNQKIGRYKTNHAIKIVVSLTLYDEYINIRTEIKQYYFADEKM